MKKPTHIFVDFDETLFNRYAYMDWLDAELHNQGMLPKGPGSFKAAVDDFHDIKIHSSRLRLYRHEDHLRSLTTTDWEFVRTEIPKLIEVQELDFCYPDSHEFMAWLQGQHYDVALLTYGDKDYQHYKISLCKHLRDTVPVLVTDLSKNIYLKQEFPTTQGILIDDKYPLNLPENWEHIWIDRDEVLAQQKFEGIPKVNSLKEIKKYLHNHKLD